MKKVAKNITGQRFGKLLVISRQNNDYKDHSIWKCLCDCGKAINATGYRLINEETTSCGCLRKEKIAKSHLKAPGYSGMVQLYNNYKRSAKKKGHIFDLSIELFQIITSSNCYYCNSSPNRISYNRSGNNAYTIQRSAYMYNGIDRTDNFKGYTLKNCVSCCFTCNDWKSNMLYDDFLNQIEKIFLNLKSRRVPE